MISSYSNSIRIKRFFIFLLFLSYLTTISAKNYYFRQYRNEDGLSHNTVFCSMQDQNGFMWFGTQDGLSRFNGNSFATFQHEPGNKKSICTNVVNCLCQDPDGLIWIGTNDGVCNYNQKTDEFSQLNNIPLQSRSIVDIQTDFHENIWIQTLNGFFQYNKKTEKLKSYLPQSYFQSKRLTIGSAGTPWIASSDSLYRYDFKTDTFSRYSILTQKEKDNFSEITSIIDAGEYGILLATNKSGLKRFDPNTGSVETFLASDSYGKTIYMRVILCYSPDEYWIGTESGIYIFNMKTKEVKNIRRTPNNPYSLGDNAIYTLVRDSEGGVWAGTYFRGISYLPKEYTPFEKILDLGQSGDISGEVVREIKGDQYGNLWIGTEDAGLNKYDAKTGKFTHFTPDGRPGSIAGLNIHGLLVNGDNLWIGYYEQGIDIMDIRSGKVIKHYKAGKNPTDLKTNFIVTIYKTSENKILLGTLVGVYEYNPQNDDFTFREDLAPRSFIYSIYEGSDHTIWVGSLGSGLFYETKDGKTGNFKEVEENKNSLSSNAVTDIFEDSKNRIWVSTRGNGFCEFNKKTESFVRHTTKDGIPSNIIYKILEDSKGRLWISTPKGLLNFDPETKLVKNYSRLHGLTDDQFNYNSGYKDKLGKMYFGTTNGMITFTPERFVENTFEPPVYITGFQVLNKEYKIKEKNSANQKSIIYTDKITLPYDQSTFSIDFAALSYVAPEMNEYMYFMEGLDKTWTYLKTYRKAYYTNIPPGEYTFHVKSSNSNGQWSLKEKTLKITITPPFWDTVWAYLLYFLFITSLIVITLRIYTKRLKYSNQLKLEKIEDLKQKEILNAKIEFFTNIAHEIRTPLTLIKGPLDRIVKSGGNLSASQENLAIMQKNTNRLLDLSNQLLDFRKTEMEGTKLNFIKYNICDILKETFLRFTPIAKEQDIHFILNCTLKQCLVVVDKEALTKIQSNLLTNALKFAEKTVEVSLSLVPESGTFIIRVNNDGNLIPPEMKEKIFDLFFQYEGSQSKIPRQGTGIGLYLARSLAELHKGTLSLDTTVKGFNSFVLELPCHQDSYIKLDDEQTVSPEKDKITKSTFDQELESDTRPTILVVEDVKDMLDFISRELADTYKVVKALNGEEALSVLKKGVVNLIISDISMPVMDGFELCKYIKSNIDYSHIPFILLTAKHNIQTQIEGLELGADAYIGKPFNSEHLIAQISNLLKNRNSLMENFAKSPFVFSSTIASTNADKMFLKNLNEIISNKLSDTNLSVDYLAETLGISISGLYRKMKGVCDMNPNEFIRITRLKKAATLLIETDLSMKEIAYLTGFSSPSYFSSSFMKQFGLKPSEFVSKYRKQ